MLTVCECVNVYASACCCLKHELLKMCGVWGWRGCAGLGCSAPLCTREGQCQWEWLAGKVRGQRALFDFEASRGWRIKPEEVVGS